MLKQRFVSSVFVVSTFSLCSLAISSGYTTVTTKRKSDMKQPKQRDPNWKPDNIADFTEVSSIGTLYNPKTKEYYHEGIVTRTEGGMQYIINSCGEMSYSFEYEHINDQEKIGLVRSFILSGPPKLVMLPKPDEEEVD